MTAEPLVPLEAVRATILDAVAPLEPVSVPLNEALGLVAASAVVAAHDVPAFANSAMDGYAVRAADTAGAPVELAVVGTVAAGSGSLPEVGPGQAARIMTGAPLPWGADAIVMVERTEVIDGSNGLAVRIGAEASPGDFVRRPGGDVAAGDTVIEAGTPLSPPHLGIAASIGAERLDVFPAARVGVLSTGDELQQSSGPLAPGHIHDANRPMLIGLVREARCTPVDLGMAPDDEEAIRTKLGEAVGSCDAVLMTGGVSVGDYDYVKAVIAGLERSWWWQVAVRPAKPLAFGVSKRMPVFGLPGNPVSSAVSFELFARPALRKITGHRDVVRPALPAIADENLRRVPDGKLHLVRVLTAWGDDGRLRVRPAGGQGSHILSAMAAAGGLALLPDGDGVDEGESVEVMVLK